MNKKKTIILIGLIFIFGLLCMIPFRHQIKNRLKSYFYSLNKKDDNCPQCDQFFTDGISTQEQAYKKEGISPQNDFTDLYKLEKQGILVKIEENEYYHIKDLDHSVPLLLPVAKFFLNDLGKSYQQKCIHSGLNYVPYSISSMTRSINSVNELQKKNNNAIGNSVHLKGKTFDITYLSPHSELNQKNLLIESLAEMRNSGRCYVKYESQQHCLHITVR